MHGRFRKELLRKGHWVAALKENGGYGCGGACKMKNFCNIKSRIISSESGSQKKKK